MPPPADPKIYHIVHVDRLTSVVMDGCLWSDAEIGRHNVEGTMIGMAEIKQRRLALPLECHPNLHVGDFVPFYFCPRSVMLYVIYMANHPSLGYRGGQEPIVHLEADMRTTVNWANRNQRRWAFTTSNAGSYYFEDYNDLDRLDQINWNAVNTKDWQGHKEFKQAEFLVELSFPWHLISRIGVRSKRVYNQVAKAVSQATHRPGIEVKPDWYY
ncbi:MAG: DUF4433 domain-containing protein [Gammaproteobacteria bacterium]|nr:DUF4433 domain-containing protein [Gammaproteobacteria bacterium]